MLRLLEVHREPIVTLNLSGRRRHLFDRRQLEHRLRVVRYRTVGVDGDRHGAHAKEPERHEAERKHGRRNHQRSETHVTDQKRDGHQQHDRDAKPIGAEVTGDEAGQNVQRRAALTRRRNDFAHVTRLGRRKDLYELWNDRAGERAARDDARELPPQRAVAKRRDHHVRHDVREDHRQNRRQPDEEREWRLEVHLVDVLVTALCDRTVDQVRHAAGHDHHDAHGEDPDEELDLNRRFFHREHDERDERNTRHAVGFEAVGARTDRVTGIVAGTVGDDTWIARVILLDVEDDLHQVGADVGNLREDTAGDTQRRGTKRFTDREADEARARVVAWNEEQNRQHQHELDRDQQHADAHARAERNRVARIRLAPQRGERRPRIRKGVDANAEPGNAIAAADADQAEEQDHDHFRGREVLEHAEVERDDRPDEHFQEQDELALRYEICLTRLVDELRDGTHRRVHRHVLEARIDDESEQQAERADEQSALEQPGARHAEERHVDGGSGQVRDDEVRFATSGSLERGRRGAGLRCLGDQGGAVKRRSEHRHHDRKHDGEDTTERVLHQIHRLDVLEAGSSYRNSGAEKKPM